MRTKTELLSIIDTEIFTNDCKKYNKKYIKEKYMTSYELSIEELDFLIDSLYPKLNSYKKTNSIREKSLALIHKNFTEEEIKSLVNDKTLSANDIAKIFQSKDNNISYKTSISLINDYGYSRTKEESNAIRRAKSKTFKNNSWLVKKQTIEAIENSQFKTFSNFNKNYLESNMTLKTFCSTHLKEPYSIRSIQKLLEHPKNKITNRFEKEVQTFFSQNFNNIKLNDRNIINPKELDIVLEDFKIAVECNGDYWHSDEVIKFNYGIDAYTHHKNKYNLTKEKGYELLYIWEKDWLNNREEIIAKLKAKNFKDPIFHKFTISPIKNYTAPNFKANIIRKYLKTSNIDFNYKNKIFYIESFKFAISIANETGNKDTLNYLIEKGYEVLTIYPWHDNNQIKNYLKYKLHNDNKKRVYARKTNIITYNKLTPELNQFIENNHILGKVPHKNFIKAIGLEYDNELIALATFIEKTNNYELKRLVFNSNYTIPGGASKLIKNFTKKYNDKKLLTYSDRNLSEGNVYKTIGFTPIKIESSQIVYYNNKLNRKFTKGSLYTIGADRLLKNIPNYKPVGIGDALPSNEEIVLNYDFVKYEDCGNILWEYRNL